MLTRNASVFDGLLPSFCALQEGGIFKTEGHAVRFDLDLSSSYLGRGSHVGSTIKTFDGKNYKAWAYNMKKLLNRERCKGIVDRTEVPPASPTKAVAAERDEDGKPIPRTGSAGAAAPQVFTDYPSRVWAALRLISQSLQERIHLDYIDIDEPADLWDAVCRDYFEKPERRQYDVRNDLTAIKLEACGTVDAYGVKIQDLLDQYKLDSEDNDSIGVKKLGCACEWNILLTVEWDLRAHLAATPQTPRPPPVHPARGGRPPVSFEMDTNSVDGLQKHITHTVETA
ncbi:hypothetical protein FN846DRAFT_912488 [Sphaerosporella brunnea]|uniref:Retrotransposon Copia-like N-terminal domain-containing protein n=1 Tax=Sphaerosporella brunnea TaxID=1250544 RepID=A0A5J5EHV8_9PEZI|nr:hypothetical protein FN846DRAFT_912488 [Sphaerosporella brunnea]